MGNDSVLSDLACKPVTAARAVLRATYNVGSFHALPGEDYGEPSISQFLYEVSPNADRGYVEEKCELWRESQLRFMRHLDHERFEKFVAWCVRHFGSESLWDRRLGEACASCDAGDERNHWLGHPTVEKRP